VRALRLIAGGGLVLAAMLAVMSLAGLTLAGMYARETASWTAQAHAQDWFDLVVATPVIVIAALWARAGSRRGLLVLAGTMLFAVYTLVIYAFAVHLNRLFLLYCAALGVALFTLAGTCARLWHVRHDVFTSHVLPRRSASVFLVFIGIAFGGLWLAQLLPALITGRVPPELADAGLATNPVHVLDLSCILPLHLVAGVALWRMRSLMALLAPIMLVFGAMMSASIATLAAMSGALPLTCVMGAVALVSSVLSTLVIRAFE